MKRKLVAIALVTILLATILSGCTLFVKNDERDYKQTLATVENRGISSTITKGEFYDYYSQTAPVYIQYYGWDAAKCVNEFMNALARKEILLIEARHFFATAQNKKIDASLIDFLSPSERAWVIRRTNKTFQDAMDEQVKQIVSDDKANAGETEDTTTVSTLPTPRPAKPTVDEDEKYKESMPTAEEEKFFDALDKKTLTATEKKAIAKVKKSLENQYKDYNYFLEQQSENRVLDKYREAVKNGKLEGYAINITDEDVVKKYNLTLNTQAISNANEASYKTALDGESTLIYHNNQYVKVKSILLKFTDKQTAILDAVKEFYKGNNDADAIIANIRKMLVTGGSKDAFPISVEQKQLGLLVNISNLDYKADSQCTAAKGTCTCSACPNSAGYDENKKKKCEIILENKETNEFIHNVPGCTCAACENHAYEMYNVPYADVLSKINTAVAKAAKDAEAEYATKYPNGNGAGKQMYVANARQKEFENWIYKTNDDPGMMEGKEYIGTPEGKASDYVVEYTALIRALIDEGVTKDVTKKDATGATNYLEGATKGVSYADTFEYKVDNKTIPIYNVTDVDGNKMSYIINDFGVHIVMLTTVPVDMVINETADITSKVVIDPITQVKDTHYTLGQNAIVGFDEETGLPITLSEQMKKAMVDQYKTDLYNKYEHTLVKDYGKVLFAKANNKVFKLNRGVFNEIVTLTGAVEKDINI